MSEKKYRTLTLWIALGLLVLVLVTVGACGETPPPEPTIETTEEPTAALEPTTPAPEEETAKPGPIATLVAIPTCEPGDERSPSLLFEDEAAQKWTTIEQGVEFDTQDGLTFVRDEVIVMGPHDLVEDAVKAVLDLDSLQPNKYVLTLSDLLPESALESLQGAWPEIVWEENPLILGLFPTFGLPAPEAVVALNVMARQARAPLFAELNVVTGHPHSVAGSPHSVAGSPLKLDGVPVTKAFWGQWALGPAPGIGLVSTTTYTTATRQIEEKGAGVQIAVFDSSPFDRPGTWEIDWITPALTLKVSHVLPQVEKATASSDHGLFVCGLIHAVAPESEIHLVQALNENLTGTLGTLDYVLVHYMRERLAENGQTLTNTVMNFSLGLSYDPESPSFAPVDWQQYGTWIRAFAGGAIDPMNMPLPSFATLMALADHYGAALVAASGNGTEDLHNRIELPAAFPFVLSVQASGVDGTETCYTKPGEVAAPGGDPALFPPGRCPKRVDGGCKRGIISLAPRTSPCSGYACWVGTSFAAPLVSGELATILDCNASISAQGLRAAVFAGAPAPASNTTVISLPNTFGNLTCP